MLMYPNASSYLTHGIEPQRVGNRGYTGSPTADTYRCADGWLATAANTPAQFRALARVLGLEALCEDAQAIDLDAFRAPGGGFVIARDLPRLQQTFRDAFARRSATEMEAQLNAVGVPAARVRRLGEFLDEAQATGTLVPAAYAQGDAHVRTPGLGFRYSEDGAWPSRGAPSVGHHTQAVLTELGMQASQIEALRAAGAVGYPIP